MTLQRLYYNWFEATAAGENTELVDLGDSLVDGWLVRVEVIVVTTTAITVNSINVVSIGVETQPQALQTVINSGADYLNNPLLDMFSDSVDAMWWHGSDWEMPLFHVLAGTGGDGVGFHYKKLFRRVVNAGDVVGLRISTNSISGAADVAGVEQTEGFVETVISPRKWK